MMTRLLWPFLGAVAVAACSPTVPDSAKGVGFGSYTRYPVTDRASQIAAGREAQLQTPLRVSPETTGAPRATTGAGQRPAVSATELAAAGINISPDVRVESPQNRVIYGPATAPAVGPTVQISPLSPGAVGSTSGRPAPQPTATDPGAPLSAIRTEASAVGTAPVGQTPAVPATGASTPTAARAATQPAEPVTRPAQTGPDIVAMALGTTHAVGTPVYPRTFGSDRKAARACARFAAPDVAQRAFLQAGGPERDRLGVDPDGDGFACGWDPAPFRNAVNG